jgi:biopolymer transport protein ExbD
MAGASIGDNEENPVAINVTAMVDVIFCLCLFFMCSLHFKQVEGKFDTWLPKGKGTEGVGDASQIIQEIRVAIFWDANLMQTIRQLGTRRVNSDEELELLITEARDDFVRMNRPEIPVTIDSDPRVPWSAVIDVVNICKKHQIDKIEFAMGAALP